MKSVSKSKNQLKKFQKHESSFRKMGPLSKTQNCKTTRYYLKNSVGTALVRPIFKGEVGKEQK